jgi:hypothetical protein
VDLNPNLTGPNNAVPDLLVEEMFWLTIIGAWSGSSRHINDSLTGGIKAPGNRERPPQS